MVVHQSLDLSLSLKVLDGNSGKRTVDLHSVNQRRLRDHLEGGDLLKDSVVGRSVKNNHVLGLFVGGTMIQCKKQRRDVSN